MASSPVKMCWQPPILLPAMKNLPSTLHSSSLITNIRPLLVLIVIIKKVDTNITSDILNSIKI